MCAQSASKASCHPGTEATGMKSGLFATIDKDRHAA